MQSGFIFGIIGSVLLLMGVFVPLVSQPVYGGINLFQIQPPVAILLVVLSAAHLAFCVTKVAWGLYVTKIGVLGAIGYGIFHGWDKIAHQGNFVTNLIKPIVKVHWGTGLLAAGILIVMAAAIPHLSASKTTPEPSSLPAATEE